MSISLRSNIAADINLWLMAGQEYCRDCTFHSPVRFYPLVGDAKGLLQPIHVEDVAALCLSALKSPTAANCAYNIFGREILPYREIVKRVFAAQHRKP
jgi:nucleoside-diphosphate-sugar epimerase